MFTIDSLWKIEALQPLKKAHERNPMDSRLVVVVGGNQEVDTKETEALHRWLESQSYQSIPAEWETDDLDCLQVVHVSKMTLQVLRQDPFNPTPTPLTPNSWLNRLPQERFDAILLAQELGDIEMQPTRLELKDRVKPALESESLSGYWKDAVASVGFANSGQAPKNLEQHRVMNAWQRVIKRRHYDPSARQVVAINPSEQREVFVATRTYDWGSGSWNQNHTQLRRWIADRVHETEDLRVAALDVFGSTVRLRLDGSLVNIAHNIVNEAVKVNRLDELASYFGFQQTAGSAFNQEGQTIYGQQINTGGGAYISGDVVAGDFVGGDKISVSVGSNSRNVAIGGNINQSTIITGDSVIIRRNR